MGNFPIKSIVFAALALFSVFLFSGSFQTIDQGDVGVKLRNGAFVEVLAPGLAFKLPIVDTIHELSTRVEKQQYKTSGYSRDIQDADFIITVTYKMDASAAEQVYSQYQSLEGAVNRIITPRVMDSTKDIFGTFNASTSISERGRLTTEMRIALQKVVLNTGIMIDSVQIEDIDYSDVFEKSVEDRMLAEVEVERLKQNAEREVVQAQIVVVQANAKADAVRAEAEAQAFAVEIKGKAEATSINARGKALRDNPNLVQLISAERWDGKLPETMVPNGAVPFVNVDKQK